MKTIISTDAAPKAIGPYSQAVVMNGFAFLSGQIPLDPSSGELVGGSVAAQARRCLDNLAAVCDAAGTTLSRAARITIYMTDLAAFGEVNEVCAEVFTSDPPARATVGVAALPRGARVEVECILSLA